MTDRPTLYPLGRNIYASVKTWRHSVKIHICHYAVPTNTKGGRVVPTQRGVVLDLKEFQCLLKAKSKLCQEYTQLESALPPTPRPALDPVSSRASGETEDRSSQAVTQQQQVPLSAAPTLTRGNHSDSNHSVYYNPHRDPFFFLDRVSMQGHWWDT